MAGIAHQIFEQLELARQQLDRLVAAFDRAGQEIEFEIGDPQLGRRRRRRAAPQQRLEPREQLAEGKGLDQIVVAAGAQALDPVVDAAQRTEDQRRRADLGGAQRAEHRQPVHARQHAVEDDRVVTARGGEEQALASVARLVDRIAALAQTLDQIGGGFAIVFDDEELHRILWRSSVAGMTTKWCPTARRASGGLPFDVSTPAGHFGVSEVNILGLTGSTQRRSIAYQFGPNLRFDPNRNRGSDDHPQQARRLRRHRRHPPGGLSRPPG